MPGAPYAIRLLNEAGYRVIIVPTQRGVAKGMMTMADVADVHRYMEEELARQGAHVDGIYVCPHDVGECTCRKPDIGLFLMAEKDFCIDKSRSWMIGDSETDIQAGERYGVRTLLSNRLLEAVETILKQEKG